MLRVKGKIYYNRFAYILTDNIDFNNWNSSMFQIVAVMQLWSFAESKLWEDDE